MSKKKNKQSKITKKGEIYATKSSGERSVSAEGSERESVGWKDLVVQPDKQRAAPLAQTPD